jgi:predicted  nucleic acid-binding Zn-ribbon protein
MSQSPQPEHAQHAQHAHPALTAPLTIHVVSRPFIGAEKTTPFEQQPVPRPVLDINEGTPNTVKLLDPAMKYKVKREWPMAGKVHWFPPDGDIHASPVPAATIESTTGSTAATMAQHIFDGFNTTVLVMGHAKAGKSTILFGDLGSGPKGAEDAADGMSSSQMHEPDGQAKGLVPRFATELYAVFAKKPSNSTMTVELEMVGIDDTHVITDLLQAKKAATTGGPRHVDPEKLAVREDPSGPTVAGTHRTTVDSPSSFVTAVRLAVSRYRKMKARATTHVVLLVRCTETLTFADPKSPSETITKTGHALATFTLVAGRHTAFFRCVDSASSRDRGENPMAKVPFRESSLTRLIQDFFGANTFGCAFACVSPYFGYAKDAAVVLDLAMKLEPIKTHPRQSYDETTSEFRRLDDEVNTLSSELSQAKEAYEVVQHELDTRHSILCESRRVFEEQHEAVEDIHEELRQDGILIAVQQHRSQTQRKKEKTAADALKEEVRDAELRKNNLASQIENGEKTLVMEKATIEAARLDMKNDNERQAKAEAEISRQKKRYDEVEESQQGLGGIKTRIEREHAEAVGTKETDAKAMRAETAELDKKTKEIEMPLRMAQMASDSINTLRKRIADAKKRSTDLDNEEKKLKEEIPNLEHEVAELEKEANKSGCCTVM